MIRRHSRLATLSLGLLALSGIGSAEAQYFGRNKVQYEKFDWRILKTDHFDLYYYPAESLKVWDAGRQSERWYTRLSDIFRHQFDRKSLVFYADHPDFQQTNVVSDVLSEGTGGVTEGMRTRVVMPWTGIYADDEHVLGHELVHVFQYNIAETAPGQGGIARLGALPLWLVEGMAEYFSLGRNDALTAMWMRDAVMQDRFPTIRQLTTDSRFFPYRYGQALWAYIGGRWGDRAVVDVYRTALRVGWDASLVRALGLSGDSLSADWAAANKAFYAGQVAGRTHPDSIGRTVIPLGERSEYNIGPAQSADGKYVAFFTTKTNLFGIELVLAEAATGRIIRRLSGPQSDGHFDAISFINSSGDFSPDGSRFAFIVYSDGDNQIHVLNTENGDIVREFKPDNVGAVYNVAWSPDGRQLVFSGAAGGISDLYLADVASGAVRQLTNDRYADMQPTFSPDGRTIAFATDREGTNFDRLTFGALRLATLDVASGQVTLLDGFQRGKHINPQFSPDGQNLFFISDQDGISDLYRLSLADRSVHRITRLATGVSGVTSLSPAISMARGTGTLMFTVFKNQGYAIVALDGAQLTGEPVDMAAAARIASAATLPPGDVAGNMTVASYLSNPMAGLVSGAEFRIEPYDATFSLDAIGQPSIGISAGGPFGTGLAGGISALWGDQLSDQVIYGAMQLNGTIKDFGAAVFYQNLANRWNWMGGVQHIPYLQVGQGYSEGSADCPGTCYYQLVQRVFVDEASLSAQYPFSPTRRFEMGLSGTYLSWHAELDTMVVNGAGFGTNRGRRDFPAPDPLAYGQASAAYVGDNSFFGFTSPITGGRFRFEASPTFGEVSFNTALADVRRYFFVRPFTFAARGMHYARYGADADNYERLTPLYLGEETLIRGYSAMSLSLDECTAEQAQGCPVFDRLLGSRIAVANLEMRIPVLGTSSFGLINFPYLPLEVSPFLDAGLAWTSDQSPVLAYQTSANATPSCNVPSNPASFYPCAQRIPVFSTGVSMRFNLMGYAVLETYFAKPFQRPTRDWVFGLQLAPGW